MKLWCTPVLSLVWVFSSEERKGRKKGSFVVFQRKDQLPCEETLKMVGQFSLESKRQNMTNGCILQNPEGTYKVSAELMSYLSSLSSLSVPLSKQKILIIFQISDTSKWWKTLYSFQRVFATQTNAQHWRSLLWRHLLVVMGIHPTNWIFYTSSAAESISSLNLLQPTIYCHSVTLS